MKIIKILFVLFILTAGTFSFNAWAETYESFATSLLSEQFSEDFNSPSTNSSIWRNLIDDDDEDDIEGPGGNNPGGTTNDGPIEGGMFVMALFVLLYVLLIRFRMQHKKNRIKTS